MPIIRKNIPCIGYIKFNGHVGNGNIISFFFFLVGAVTRDVKVQNWLRT